jgi:hypothetical protein
MSVGKPQILLLFAIVVSFCFAIAPHCKFSKNKYCTAEEPECNCCFLDPIFEQENRREQKQSPDQSGQVRHPRQR